MTMSGPKVLRDRASRSMARFTRRRTRDLSATWKCRLVRSTTSSPAMLMACSTSENRYSRACRACGPLRSSPAWGCRRIARAEPKSVDHVAGIGGGEEEISTRPENSCALLQRPDRVVPQMFEDLGEDDAVEGAVGKWIRHLLQVPLHERHSVLLEESQHAPFGVVGPPVGGDPDVDGRRSEACIGESTNLVSRCSAELDDGGRRPEALADQVVEELISRLGRDVERHWAIVSTLRRYDRFHRCSWQPPLASAAEEYAR